MLIGEMKNFTRVSWLAARPDFVEFESILDTNIEPARQQLSLNADWDDESIIMWAVT